MYLALFGSMKRPSELVFECFVEICFKSDPALDVLLNSRSTKESPSSIVASRWGQCPSSRSSRGNSGALSSAWDYQFRNAVTMKSGISGMFSNTRIVG